MKNQTTIEEDIQEFQARIEQAKEKLSTLHVGLLPYQQHKAREAVRRELTSDIEHYTRLKGYAQEALNERN